MDKHDKFLAAIEEFHVRPWTGRVPSALQDYLRWVATTGETLFPWSKVKAVFAECIDQAMKDFNTGNPMENVPPCANVEQVKFEEMRRRILEALNLFTGAPFTIQRLTELITHPSRHYMRTDKFLRGIEKNVMVVSTVDPSGRKVVSEPSRPVINGTTPTLAPPKPYADSPFVPPAPSNSPVCGGGGWLGRVSSPTTDSPLVTDHRPPLHTLPPLSQPVFDEAPSTNGASDTSEHSAVTTGEATVGPTEAVVAHDTSVVVPSDSNVVSEQTTVDSHESTVAPDESTVANKELAVVPSESTVDLSKSTVVSEESHQVSQESTTVSCESSDSVNKEVGGTDSEAGDSEAGSTDGDRVDSTDTTVEVTAETEVETESTAEDTEEGSGEALADSTVADVTTGDRSTQSTVSLCAADEEISQTVNTAVTAATGEAVESSECTPPTTEESRGEEGSVEVTSSVPQEGPTESTTQHSSAPHDGPSSQTDAHEVTDQIDTREDPVSQTDSQGDSSSQTDTNKGPDLQMVSHEGPTSQTTPEESSSESCSTSESSVEEGAGDAVCGKRRAAVMTGDTSQPAESSERRGSGGFEVRSEEEPQAKRQRLSDPTTSDDPPPPTSTDDPQS